MKETPQRRKKTNGIDKMLDWNRACAAPSGKAFLILLNAIPMLIMINLIPIIGNDYILAGVYILIIVAAFLIRYEKEDAAFFMFGFFIMTFSEYLFISTGVETFVRRSLFGIMPVWLPLLWAYGFVAMKRAVRILMPLDESSGRGINHRGW